jgi:thioredoxin-related protein
MKSKGSVFLMLLCVCAALLAFINNHPFNELGLNSAIPMADMQMKDVSGKTVTLAEAKKEKGLLVVFSCNTCPYVKMTEGRIKEYSDMCLGGNIGCVIVNSNEAQRNEEDSFAEMVKYYKTLGLNCYYTVDEQSRLANGFGAGRTPQCFLFNGEGKLVYKGAIDDNVKDPSQVKNAYLKDAITAVLKNEIPKVQETKSIGCTIKRLD